MALKDCLRKIQFDDEDRAELTKLVIKNKGDEMAAVREFAAGIEADFESARQQLIDQGYDVALPEDAAPIETERTEAGEQTVIPGAEQSKERSEEARKADQKREMDARAKQSKMGTAASQDEPGGLFDAQGDLLGTSATSGVPSVSQPEAVDRSTIPAAEAEQNIPEAPQEDKSVKHQAAAVARGHAPARRQAANFSEARQAVKEFQGQTLVNRDSGIEAIVSRNTLDKMLSRSAVSKSDTSDVHTLAVANLDALYENSIYGWKSRISRKSPQSRESTDFLRGWTNQTVKLPWLKSLSKKPVQKRKATHFTLSKPLVL